MADNVIASKEYRDWLSDIKQKVQRAQLKAATAVNTALLEFYWSLGADIAEKQKHAAWGSGFLAQLSKDLMAEFPEMKGFSKRNLECIKKWHLFYSQENTIAKQPASQLQQHEFSLLLQIPWWHNVVIIQKCETIEQALFYVRKTVENNWSRSVLVHQIESDLYDREGKAYNGRENLDRSLRWFCR